MENSENSPDLVITPAPGKVLVRQDKTTGGSIGGFDIAAKTTAMHEGVVIAIGFVPKRYAFGLKAGDRITFGRFNAVTIPGEELLSVDMSHIVCKKVEVVPVKGWLRKLRGAFLGARFAGAFAAGWFANDLFALAKGLIKKTQ